MKVLIACLVFSALVVSQARADQALDQLLACRRTADSAARLECFDRAADAASTVKTHDPPTPPPSLSLLPSPSKPSQVESSIARIARPLNRSASFTLENGQVWRLVDADDTTSAKVGNHVVVAKKSAIGAYWMQVEGNREWRVALVR